MSLVLNPYGLPTADLNPAKILDHDRMTLPIVAADGTTATAEIVTVLKAGGAGDMAAYQAIIPSGSKVDELLTNVARFGNKLREPDAAKIFGAQMAHLGTYRR